jgi:hypothetical protein
MTATHDGNNEGPDATAQLQAEAVTDEGALDKLMARGNLTAAPAAVATHITDWEGLTPAEETEAHRKEAQQRDEYARQMEQVRERADELLARLDEQERETRQKIAEADSRAIVLADGRRVLVGKNGDYIDEASGMRLDGNDKTEAAGKRQANSETEEEHNRLKEALAKNLEAKDRVLEATALASQDGANPTPEEKKQQAARAESDLAMAQAVVTAREDHYSNTPEAALTSTDALSALGLGAAQNDRTTSFAATMEGKDSRAIAMRDDFTSRVQPGLAAAVKATETPAPSGTKARAAAPV